MPERVRIVSDDPALAAVWVDAAGTCGALGEGALEATGERGRRETSTDDAAPRLRVSPGGQPLGWADPDDNVRDRTDAVAPDALLAAVLALAAVERRGGRGRGRGAPVDLPRAAVVLWGPC